MVVCEFFLQGKCRFGENCRFEHQLNSNKTENQQFGNHQGQQKLNNPQTLIEIEVKRFIKSVQNHVSGQKGRQWLLSCYAPIQGRPLYPGFIDLSFEEVRYGYINAQKSNTSEQYKQEFQKKLTEAKARYKALENPTEETVQILKDIYNNELRGSDQNYTAENKLGSGPSTNPNMFRQNTVFSQLNLIRGGNSIFGQNTTQNDTGSFGHVCSSGNKQFGNNQGQQKLDDPKIEVKTFIKSVHADVVSGERGRQWLLSCYAPFYKRPLYPGFIDLSFEEVRFGYINAQKSNTLEQYKQEFQQKLTEAKARYKALEHPTEETIQILKDIYNNELSGSNQNFTAENKLGPGSSTDPNMFGQNTSTVFGQSKLSKTQSNVGSFGQLPNGSIFGKPNASVGSGRVFGQQQGSANDSSDRYNMASRINNNSAETTCSRCVGEVKNFVTCSKCSKSYHPSCILKIRGLHVSSEGQIVCCEDLTSKIKCQCQEKDIVIQMLKVRLAESNELQVFGDSSEGCNKDSPAKEVSYLNRIIREKSVMIDELRDKITLLKKYITLIEKVNENQQTPPSVIIKENVEFSQTDHEHITGSANTSSGNSEDIKQSKKKTARKAENHHNQKVINVESRVEKAGIRSQILKNLILRIILKKNLSENKLS